MQTDLHDLLERERRATGDTSGGSFDKATLRAVGEELARMAQEAHDAAGTQDVLLQLHHNRFRLSHPDLVPHDRPKVLVGGRNDAHFPSIATLPLLRVADVVSLTTRPGPPRPDRVHYDYWNERLVDILPRLPAGFRPDVYLDGNLSQRPCVPLGLEEAPFWTVAELDGRSDLQQLLATAGLFDVVLPGSQHVANALERGADATVLRLPFSFAPERAAHFLAVDAQDKGEGEADTQDKIDVLLLLDDVPAGLSSFLPAAVERIRARFGSEAEIVALHAADARTQTRAIERSRIVVRAVAPERPYDLLSAAVVAAGALLVELELREGSCHSPLIETREVVRVTADTLEAQLEELLARPQRVREMAWSARGHQERAYATEGLYRNLFESLEALERPPRLLKSRAYLALGALHLGSQNASGALAALPGVLAQPLTERIPNLTALVPRLFEHHDRERVLELLEREPAVVEAFGIDGWTGVEALACTFTEDPALRFNHAFLSVEAGKAATPVMRAALRVLEAGPAPFDLRSTLLVRPNLEGLEPEERCVETELLQRPFLAALGDDDAEWGVVSTYMRWHLLRWLYQHEASTGADRLRELLELWPGNAALQCRLGERLAPVDPSAAERAFRAALEVHPEYARAERGLTALGVEPKRSQRANPAGDAQQSAA